MGFNSAFKGLIPVVGYYLFLFYVKIEGDYLLVLSL